MSITAVDTQSWALPVADVRSPVAGSVMPGDFGKWLAHEMSTVNRQVLDAESQLRSLAEGNMDNLHHVMISMEEAKLSFQLLLQARNRLLEAYQEVLRMQV